MGGATQGCLNPGISWEWRMPVKLLSRPVRCSPSCPRASPLHPSTTPCGALTASRLPRALVRAVLGRSWRQQRVYNRPQREQIALGWQRTTQLMGCCPSPGQGRRHPGAALALADLHITECPLQREQREEMGTGQGCPGLILPLLPTEQVVWFKAEPRTRSQCKCLLCGALPQPSLTKKAGPRQSA